MTRARATIVGLSAILTWSTLAVLLVRKAPMPPFLLMAVCLALGGSAGLAWIAGTRRLGLLATAPPLAPSWSDGLRS